MDNIVHVHHIIHALIHEVGLWPGVQIDALIFCTLSHSIHHCNEINVNLQIVSLFCVFR